MQVEAGFMVLDGRIEFKLGKQAVVTLVDLSEAPHRQAVDDMLPARLVVQFGHVADGVCGCCERGNIENSRGKHFTRVEAGSKILLPFASRLARSQRPAGGSDRSGATERSADRDHYLTIQPLSSSDRFCE
nr:pre-B lymphocyte protein 3 [uncultured bacterium]